MQIWFKFSIKEDNTYLRKKVFSFISYCYYRIFKPENMSKNVLVFLYLRLWLLYWKRKQPIINSRHSMHLVRNAYSPGTKRGFTMSAFLRHNFFTVYGDSQIVTIRSFLHTAIYHACITHAEFRCSLCPPPPPTHPVDFNPRNLITLINEKLYTADIN